MIGPVGVMEKYWNDKELMGKIAEKMGQLSLHPSSKNLPSKTTTRVGFISAPLGQALVL